MTMTTDETLERLALLAMDTRYDTGVVSRQFLAGLATLIRSLRDERDAAERVRSLMAKDWLDFCDSMGVAFDTQEAVAADLRAIIGNAERERDAARAALRDIIAADDDFRASMAPGVEKDPVTLACDRARNIIGEA